MLLGCDQQALSLEHNAVLVIIMRLPIWEAAVSQSISSQSPPGLTEEPAVTYLWLVGDAHTSYLKRGPSS